MECLSLFYDAGTEKDQQSASHKSEDYKKDFTCGLRTSRPTAVISLLPRTGLKWIFGSLTRSRSLGDSISQNRNRTDFGLFEAYASVDDNEFSIRRRIKYFNHFRSKWKFSQKITLQTTKSWRDFLLDRVHLRIRFSPLSWQSCLFCVRVRSQRNDKSDTNCITTFTYFFVKGIFTFGFSHRVAIESVDRRLLVVVKRVKIVTRSVHALVQCCWRRDHSIHFHLSPRNRFSLEINLLSSFIGFSSGKGPLLSINCGGTRHEWVRSFISSWQSDRWLAKIFWSVCKLH